MLYLLKHVIVYLDPTLRCCRETCDRSGEKKGKNLFQQEEVRWPRRYGRIVVGAEAGWAHPHHEREVCVLTTEQRNALAQQLDDAERERRPIPPLIESHADLSAVDAYEIQLVNIRRRLAGAEVVGHKVGLSSPVMQHMMGVDEPDYGHLLSDMRLHEQQSIDPGRYCYPRVEVEVGFLLGDDVPGEGCTEADVLASTEALVPAIELIDSRIADWRIGIADTIADNASSAGFVLGQARIDPGEVDLRGIDAVLWRDGEQAAHGRSDAVLGNPAIAVAWLARKVAGFGVRLRAGNIVLPGSCTRAIDVAAGHEFRAEFSAGAAELGSVSLSFRQDSVPAVASRGGSFDKEPT